MKKILVRFSKFSDKLSNKLSVKYFLVVAGILMMLSTATILVLIAQINNEINSDKNIVNPVDSLEMTTIASGLNKPWELRKDVDSNKLFFTQRDSGFYLQDLTKPNNQPVNIFIPEDLFTQGEGGMLGFDLANDFESSRELYICFNSWPDTQNQPKLLLSKLKLDTDITTVDVRTDIVTDIIANDRGRHSGCRVEVDDNSHIWMTVGDIADGATPQDPENLAGKILRIDQDGNGVAGNLGGSFDDRIYSYGHRNPQGLYVFPETEDFSKLRESFGAGFISEHGPNIEDEISALNPGNFGWNPGLPYEEFVTMTDTTAYPDSIEPLWDSADTTIAPSDLTVITGSEWGSWEGTLLMAVLKDSYIVQFEIDEDAQTINQLQEVVTGYGRIRDIYQSDDGNIYFSTDNGNSEDVIVMLSAK